MKRQRIKEEKSVGTIFNNGDKNPRRFFKLMLSPASQSIYLRIPDKFAKTYIDELCTNTIAILTVPTGDTWEVTIIKEDNKLWFHKGWHKFVDNYSIDYGYFLMFKYEGNMRFNVNVFDLTTCEISYGKETCCDDLGLDVDGSSYMREIDGGDGDGDDGDSDCDCDFECLGSPLSISQDEVSDAQVIELDGDGDGADDNNCGGGGDEAVKSLDERSDHSTETLVARKGTKRTSLPFRLEPNKELMKAVIAAGIPMPENLFFPSVIKGHSLLRSMYVNIPMAFAREVVGCKADGVKFIKFEAADGKQWEVTCRITGAKSMFGKGWITFARHYQLEVGDVCVYELNPSNHNLIKVHVAKNSQMKAAGFTV